MNDMTRIPSDGVQLAIRQWGEHNTVTLLLVHGYPDCSHVWDAVAERLSAEFHVVAYDVRGAGASSAPQAVADYDLDHLIADMGAVIDTVSPGKPVHLIGHDWGSIQSWEAVTTERLRGRIASYTSISGPCLDHAGYWILNRLRSAAPSELAQLVRQAMHSWYIGAFQLPGAAPALWKLGLDQLWPKMLERLEGIEATASATQTRDGVNGIKLYRANMRQRLFHPSERRTDIPVQLIVPTQDRFVTTDVLDELPNWVERLWRFDVAAGHWLQLSHPDWAAERIADFVGFVESGKEAARLQRARVRGPRKRDSGKLVVVTGAGSGIGREMLLAFAERGADVVAVDIDTQAAERSVELARLLDANAFAYTVDVGDARAMEALAADIEQSLGTPDIVVNNAGIGMAGAFLDTSVQDWQQLLHVNLWGVIHGSRLFARQMVDRGNGGVIVNVASGLAYTPTRALPAYATSKAAVRMLSDCLRAELHDARVRVVSVCPGIIDTGITDAVRFVGTDAAEQDRRRAKARALYQRRNLKPQAVARAVLDAIDHHRDEVAVGVEAKAGRWMSRLLPGALQRLARLDVAH